MKKTENKGFVAVGYYKNLVINLLPESYKIEKRENTFLEK